MITKVILMKFSLKRRKPILTSIVPIFGLKIFDFPLLNSFETLSDVKKTKKFKILGTTMRSEIIFIYFGLFY